MVKIELDIPTLILGCGIAASGKTTLLSELVKNIYDAFIINKDTINESFLATHSKVDIGILAYRFSGPQIQYNTDYYGKYVKLQSYQYMLELAKANLLVSKHSILEGNYTKEIIKDYFDNVLFPFFEKIEHKTKIVFCYANEDVIRDRLEKRGASRDNDKLADEDWKEFLKQQPILPTELEKYDHIKVNTNPDQPLQENIEKIIEYLKS